MRRGAPLARVQVPTEYGGAPSSAADSVARSTPEDENVRACVDAAIRARTWAEGAKLDTFTVTC